MVLPVGFSFQCRLHALSKEHDIGLWTSEAACAEAGCGRAAQRACRRHGIQRWPRRQLAKLSRTDTSSASEAPGRAPDCDWAAVGALPLPDFGAAGARVGWPATGPAAVLSWLPGLSAHVGPRGSWKHCMSSLRPSKVLQGVPGVPRCSSCRLAELLVAGHQSGCVVKSKWMAELVQKDRNVAVKSTRWRSHFDMDSATVGAVPVPQ